MSQRSRTAYAAPCEHETNRVRACALHDALTGTSCSEPPAWQVFAAYDRPDPSQVHPLVARYPAPQRLVCFLHLPTALADDAAAPGSTMQWVVKPV